MKGKNRSFLSMLSEIIFWVGFGICCLLLIPVCLLLLCVRGIFSLVDGFSARVREI